MSNSHISKFNDVFVELAQVSNDIDTVLSYISKMLKKIDYSISNVKRTFVAVRSEFIFELSAIYISHIILDTTRSMIYLTLYEIYMSSNDSDDSSVPKLRITKVLKKLQAPTNTRDILFMYMIYLNKNLARKYMQHCTEIKMHLETLLKDAQLITETDYYKTYILAINDHIIETLSKIAKSLREILQIYKIMMDTIETIM